MRLKIGDRFAVLLIRCFVHRTSAQQSSGNPQKGGFYCLPFYYTKYNFAEKLPPENKIFSKKFFDYFIFSTSSGMHSSNFTLYQWSLSPIVRFMQETVISTAVFCASARLIPRISPPNIVEANTSPVP